MSTVSSSTERERLPISVAICSPVIAAVLRGVSSRYEFAIGSLCAGLYWDAPAAHTGESKGGANHATRTTVVIRVRTSLPSKRTAAVTSAAADALKSSIWKPGWPGRGK
jgi:hypothetical protein